MSLDRIHHVTISVANVEAAVKWYQTSFRCEVIESGQTFAVLQFENMRLELSLPSLERPHVAFEHGSAETFGELREMRDGSTGTYISDPTGNIVELVKITPA